MLRILATLGVLCIAQISCGMDMIYTAVDWADTALNTPGSVNAQTGNGALTRSGGLEPINAPGFYAANFPTGFDSAAYIDCTIDTTRYHGINFTCLPLRNDSIGSTSYFVELSTNGQAGPFSALTPVHSVALTGGVFSQLTIALPAPAEDNPNVVLRFHAWGGTLPPRVFGIGNVSVPASTFQPVGVSDAFSVDEDSQAVMETSIPFQPMAGSIRILQNDIPNIPGTLFPFFSQTMHSLHDFTQPAHGTLTPYSVDVFDVSDPLSGPLLTQDTYLRYEPNPGYNGPDSFTYRARVRQGLNPPAGPASFELAPLPFGITDATTVNITVNEVFDPPQANEDLFSTAEGLPLVVAAPGVLGNDSLGDLVGTPTVFTVSSVAHGTLDLKADGSFIYLPTAGYNGQDSFVYALSDGLATHSTTTVHLSVGPLNDAPVALPDSYVTFEDTPLSVQVVDGLLSNDTDIDSDTLTANLVQPPVHGALTLSGDGSFSYTPHFNFFGTDSFTYQATDGLDNSLVTTVSLNVTALNDGPALTGLSANTINEHGTVTLSGSVIDGDPGDSHQITVNWGDGSAPVQLVLPAGVGHFSVSKQFLDDNPTITAEDTLLAQVTVSDFQGGTDTANVNVLIANVSPMILNLTATSPITSGNNCALAGEIVDPGTLDTFTLSVNWGDGTPVQVVNLSAGSNSFALNHTYPNHGNYPVSVQLIDDDSGATSGTAQVVVAAAADLSVSVTASPDPAAQDEEFTYAIQVKNNGPEVATAVTLTDVLAPHLTLISSTPSGTKVGNSLSFALGDIPVGGMQIVTIRVVSSQTGTVSNTAVVSGAELDLVPANNSLTISSTVGHKDGPDLFASYVNVSAPVCKKGTCSVKGTLLLSNRGNQPANFSLLKIYLSDDTTLDGSDIPAGIIKLKTMKSLRTTTKGFRCRLPQGIATAGKFLIVKIDDTNLVIESVETNNIAVSPVLP